jgi:thymidine phosphorylase
MSAIASTSSFRIPDLIIKKRNGEELRKDEIDFFIRTICDRNNNLIQESQIGAMLMAIFFRSMSYDEAFLFTQSMMKSGERFHFPQYRNRVVDKHSTGGVGDKISLPLVPALAACGLKVPMISGRGLGFTGGTLDKLESIVGFQASLPKAKIEHLIETIGCCIVGQTQELNPADRVLYATRDVTGTVDCVPLIAGYYYIITFFFLNSF